MIKFCNIDKPLFPLVAPEDVATPIRPLAISKPPIVPLVVCISPVNFPFLASNVPSVFQVILPLAKKPDPSFFKDQYEPLLIVPLLPSDTLFFVILFAPIVQPPIVPLVNLQLKPFI